MCHKEEIFEVGNSTGYWCEHDMCTIKFSLECLQMPRYYTVVTLKQGTTTWIICVFASVLVSSSGSVSQLCGKGAGLACLGFFVGMCMLYQRSHLHQGGYIFLRDK